MNCLIRRGVLFSIYFCLFLLFCSSVIAGPVGSQQAQKAAKTFLKARNDRASKGFEPLSVTASTWVLSAARRRRASLINYRSCR